MKQTAVEWLEKICNDRGYHLMSEYFEQAKEMEKQQMMQCYEDGYNRVAKLIEDATQRNLNL
jgi:hypothetical protein